MEQNRILANQNVSKRRKDLSSKMLLLAGTFAVVTGGLFTAAKCTYETNNPPRKIEVIWGNESQINKENINIIIDGKKESFTYSPEKVGARELNHGIIVWEKIATDIYPDIKVNYPIGHLYVFKDIKTRNIVGKFAVSGGDLNNSVRSMDKGIYVLNKFESYPPFVNELGEVICEGGSLENPWGYGRFYNYPVAEKGSTLEILSKSTFRRYTTPDRLQRYLHGGALIREGFNGKADYETNKKELQETTFQPTHTIGCIKTSNYGMDFLEERINQGVFRLAYVDNIRD